jgi:hypothetical protein
MNRMWRINSTVPCPNCATPISRWRLLALLVVNAISCSRCGERVLPSFERRLVVGCLSYVVGIVVIIYAINADREYFLFWLIVVALWTFSVILVTTFFATDLQLENDASDYY